MVQVIMKSGCSILQYLVFREYRSKRYMQHIRYKYNQVGNLVPWLKVKIVAQVYEHDKREARKVI